MFVVNKTIEVIGDVMVRSFGALVYENGVLVDIIAHAPGGAPTLRSYKHKSSSRTTTFRIQPMGYTEMQSVNPPSFPTLPTDDRVLIVGIEKASDNISVTFRNNPDTSFYVIPIFGHAFQNDYFEPYVQGGLPVAPWSDPEFVFNHFSAWIPSGNGSWLRVEFTVLDRNKDVIGTVEMVYLPSTFGAKVISFATNLPLRNAQLIERGGSVVSYQTINMWHNDFSDLS